MDKLFKSAGFVPFVLIIFLNAFMDLGHKILIQNTVFKVYDGQAQIILTAVVNGLILLPFVLLFTPAGFLSDRYRKPLIMKYSAAVAVGLAALITLSYYQGWFWFSFTMTFLLAVQSAFYSPAKYGYIKERLATANAVVQAVTIVAILLGIFVFSVFFESRLAGTSYHSEAELLQTIAPVGWLLVASALLEFWLVLRLPTSKVKAPELRFDWRRYGKGRCLQDNLRMILANRSIWLSIVGLSMFWGISQVVLAAFPAFAKETLSEDQYRGHPGGAGLFGYRHHCRLTDCRAGLETLHRDGPGPPRRTGRGGCAVPAATTAFHSAAGPGLPRSGSIRWHVHRAAEFADPVSCQG